MPPRKGIVKTGNAGNSSKIHKNSGAGSPSQSADAEQEKPLFPPGSKYPLSLLQERCHKSGWDKPTVETRKHGNDWSFVVHIARFDKKTSQTESVRLEPHPPYLRPTAIEARHWGATYALYRVSVFFVILHMTSRIEHESPGSSVMDFSSIVYYHLDLVITG